MVRSGRRLLFKSTTASPSPAPPPTDGQSGGLPAQGGLSQRRLPPKGVRVASRYGSFFPTADKFSRRVAVRSPTLKGEPVGGDPHVECGSSWSGLIADPGGGQTLGDGPPLRAWLPVLGTS